MSSEWISWGGTSSSGPEGFDSSEEVRVMFRDGQVADIATVYDFDWSHQGTNSDIIAYRVVEQPTADAPVWAKVNMNEHPDSLSSYADDDNQSWIPWDGRDGGDCPVKWTDEIIVRLRGGDDFTTDRPADWRWSHKDTDGDIIAYRFIKQPCISIGPESKGVAGTNPKELVGLSKLPLHLWPPLASAYGSIGLLNGKKYGLGNYKATPVILSIYLAAILRHFSAFLEGQENDPADGTPHLSAILANVAIILEARSVGTLVDDRPMQGGYLKEIEKLTTIAQQVEKLHAGKVVKHYTIKDNKDNVT